MALQMKKVAEGTTKAVGGFREVVQDALVPELREIRAQIVALKDELHLRTDHLAKQDEQLREEIRTGLASLREEIRLRDASLREALSRDNKSLSDKLDLALNLRKRLLALEIRAERAQ